MILGMWPDGPRGGRVGSLAGAGGWSLAGVDGRPGVVAAPAGGGPGEDAGTRLFQLPPGGLFGLVVLATQRSEVALAGQAAMLERRGVVEVALAGGTAAPREGASLLPDPDQVLQPCRWPVCHGLPVVGAPGGLEPVHFDARQPGGRSGAMVGWGGTVHRRFACARRPCWAMRRWGRA